MNEQYSKIRDALLQDHPWNFACRWVELEDNGNTSHAHPTFTYEIDLPADCLRVWQLEHADEKYEVMYEGKLSCDLDTVKVKYIRSVTDPSKFSPAFAEALALKLAEDMCFAITQNNSLKGTFLSQMELYLPRVRSVDGQENPGDDLMQDVFINARY